MRKHGKIENQHISCFHPPCRHVPLGYYLDRNSAEHSRCASLLPYFLETANPLSSATSLFLKQLEFILLCSNGTRGRTLMELPSGFESLFLLQIVSDARRHCELFRREIVVILLHAFFIFEFLFKISTLLDSSLGPFSHYVGYFFGPLLAKF